MVKPTARADWRPFLPEKLETSHHSELLNIALSAGGQPVACAQMLKELIARIEASPQPSVPEQRLLVSASILRDLVEQSWDFRVGSNLIEIRPPHDSLLPGETLNTTKERLRNQLLVSSNRQLASKSVSDFIRGMHRKRLLSDKEVSVSSLVDDGVELANAIQNNNTEMGLRDCLRPYVQVCGPDDKCEHTGLSLLDVWRYFRHTWALEYNPVPGRSMRILIRNAARKNHPVMGIAMLSSAAANLYLRDKWIGWSVDDLIQKLINKEHSATDIAIVLTDALERSIENLRVDDLVDEKEVQYPTRDTIIKLSHSKILAGHRRQMDLLAMGTLGEVDLVDIRSLSTEKLKDADWKKLSSTSLFKRKRAEALYLLLSAKLAFRRAGVYETPGASILEMLTTKNGKRVVSSIIDELKKEHLATQVADLSVCGAVPPYGPLLAGKLVALLMASGEIQKAYNQRYGSQVSEISSQMAGSAVIRDSTLRLLTTTSLYGVASSQYNRLKLKPRSYRGVKDGLNWIELGKTEGFTVTHLSGKTLSRMRQLSQAYYGARRINSVFGEGSSPRTRQVREALSLVGIHDDKILKQGLARRLYALELQPNSREVLNGRAHPKIYKQPTVRAIANAWISRWVTSRVKKDRVLESLRSLGPNTVERELESRIARAEVSEGDEPNSNSAVDAISRKP